MLTSLERFRMPIEESGAVFDSDSKEAFTFAMSHSVKVGDFDRKKMKLEEQIREEKRFCAKG